MSRSTASEWRTVDKPIHTANMARALYDIRIARGMSRLEDLPEYADLASFKAFGADMLARSPHLHPRREFEHTEHFRRAVKRKYDALFDDKALTMSTVKQSTEKHKETVAAADADETEDAQSPPRKPTPRKTLKDALAQESARAHHALWPLSIFATVIIAGLLAIVVVLIYDACREECR